MALDMGGIGFQVAECDMPSQQNSTYSDDEKAKSCLVVALDTRTVAEAQSLVTELNGSAGVYKVGLELLFAEGGGLKFAEKLKLEGKKVFLDMKLHDIGNTVEKAVANVAGLGFDFLTVHGVNRRILDAAVKGRESASGSALKLLAVTVLTDQSQADLLEAGITSDCALDLALRRALMAEAAGFNGVIASGHEAKAIREAIPDENFIIKVPGIRPAGSAKDDQTRTMTPAEAMKAGATYIVVGRPIYKSSNPEAAAKAIIAEIRVGLNLQAKRR